MTKEAVKGVTVEGDWSSVNIPLTCPLEGEQVDRKIMEAIADAEEIDA